MSKFNRREKKYIMKIKGVLYLNETPHQATLQLQKVKKVANSELVDDELIDIEQLALDNVDLKNRERINLSLDKSIVINLRKLSKLNNMPMCRLVDKAILAMYQEDFKKFE